MLAYIDGSCVGNPGEAACGIVLKNEDGTILEQNGFYLGHGTNNVAEYEGLLHCLESARRYNAEILTVHSDSQLLVNQVNGRFRVKQQHLMELHKRVMESIGRGKLRFKIQYIPREENRGADRLARDAIRIHSHSSRTGSNSRGQGG